MALVHPAMSQIMQMMRQGARMIASSAAGWTRAMEECGLTIEERDLLIDKRLWTPMQRRQCREALADLTYASLTVAGLPATRVPAEYVAALIAETVEPPNWYIACHRAPPTYSALDVNSGTLPQEIETLEPEILLSLVMQYASNKDMEEQNRMNVETGELEAIQQG